MCLAIYKPANQIVCVSHLEEGFIGNPHGAGFAYLKDGAIVTRKGFFKFHDFLKAYENEVSSETPALIHFRYATHGEKNEFNCHPWDVCNGEYVAIHNGILNIQSTDAKSDTGHFVDLVLTPVISAMGNPAHHSVKYLIEQAIGSGNKILVMSKTGEVTIYNEKSGTWDGGIWYSNCGYQPSRYSYRTNFMPDEYYGGYGASSTSRKGRKHKSKMRYTYSGVVQDDEPEVTPERESFPDYDKPEHYNAEGTEICDACDHHLYIDEIITVHPHWGSVCENCAAEIAEMEAYDNDPDSADSEVSNPTSQAWEVA